MYDLKMLRELINERMIRFEQKKEIIVHKYMIYQCQSCGTTCVMWLEKGIEDKKDDEITGHHKPTPFMIGCPCCGNSMMHVHWECPDYEMEYRDYRKYVSATNYPVLRNIFANFEDEPYGVPIIFNVDFNELGIDQIRQIIILTQPDDILDRLFNPIVEEYVPEHVASRKFRRHTEDYDENRYIRPRKNKKPWE